MVALNQKSAASILMVNSNKKQQKENLRPKKATFIFLDVLYL